VRPRPVCALALTLALACGGARAADPDGGTRKLATQLGNLEDAVDVLVRSYANPTAIVRQFPNERRLVDARVFYELGQYENAAMLLFDVLDRPDFRGHLEYEATQLLLGDCLLRMNNPQAARELFLKVAQGRDPHLSEEARLFLLELALGNPRSSEATLRRAVDDLPGTPTSDRTRYGLGKAHLRLGDLDRAIELLEEIGPASPLYYRSRFYVGAALVAKGQVDLALEVFRMLTLTRGQDRVAQELRDQAWLAVGRLLVQRGDFDVALTSYQHIDRHSPHYEAAVYEMSWAYINQDKLDKALQTVEVLLLTVQDEQRAIDAQVLRGQLSAMLRDYDEALASYQTIIDRFAPVRGELAELGRDPEAVQRYFRWLLERNQALGRLRSPVSEKTGRWLESISDFERVGAVFDRIAAERQDIETAHTAGETLGKMLAAGNRVEMFPELRHGWTQALVLGNQLVLIAGQVLDRQHADARDRLEGDERDELARIVSERRRLEDEARRLPTSFEAFQARQDEVGRRYRELEKKRFLVEESIDEVQRQLLGVETYLNNKQYADDGDKLSPEQEASLRADIGAEKTRLEALYDELTGLRREIELETRSVGVGDEATQSEDELKAELRAAIAREGGLWERVGARLGGSVERDLRARGELITRALTAVERLGSVVAAIDREVGDKTAALLKVVRGELGDLEGYRARVGALDAEGRRLAGEMGDAFFERALGRLDQVVLEANVGLLDVMWARKSEKSVALQELGEERARRLRQLQLDLESIKSGAAEEAAEKVAPPAADEGGAPLPDAPPAPLGDRP